jgi:MinD-like ATPase involved in chromosome partitioning or flagellar assembly
MKTITFYSYKGGVGRTLALANIATRLAEFGKKVCLLDFDLEAPGLPYKFSAFKKIDIKKGLVDYIHQFSNEGFSSEICEFSYSFLNFSLSSTAEVESILIPAGDINSSDYWKKLSSINWNELLFENKSGLAFFLNLKEKIKNEIAPDYLLIDSRTGISEMSGITLSLLADEVVIVTANNRENLDGAKKIIKSITDPENNIFGRVPKITFILSRVPFTEKPDDKAKEQNLIAKILREFDRFITEVNIIHSDRELEEDEQIRIGYEMDGIDPQISRDYLQIFEKLTIGDFTQDQRNKFENIKKAERQYQRSVTETNLLKKLEYINKAIELNPQHKEFFLFRAAINEKLEDNLNIIRDCDQVIYLDTSNIRAYELKGKTLFKLKDYERSKEAYESILRFDENYLGAKLGLADIYVVGKNYNEALIIYNEIIQRDNENVIALAGRANLKLLTNSYNEALKDVYQALFYNSEYIPAIAMLAEINARLSNTNEFYLNLERALKLDVKFIETFIKSRNLLELFINNDRFNKLVEKYSLHLENNE